MATTVTTVTDLSAIELPYTTVEHTVTVIDLVMATVTDLDMQDLLITSTVQASTTASAMATVTDMVSAVDSAEHTVTVDSAERTRKSQSKKTRSLQGFMPRRDF